MPAILTKNLRLHNAEQFIESLVEPSNTILYAFVAKSSPWENGLDSSNVIPNQLDNVELKYNIHDQLIALKRITSSDVEYVIPRYDWVENTVYNYYDHRSNTLFDVDITSKPGRTTSFQQPFYVMDAITYNVYKCLANSKGSISTVRPTSTSNDAFTTADGYTWKYMYTIPSNKRQNFVNSDFIYVAETNYSPNVDGALDVVVVTNPGTGYTSTPNVIIRGDGSGAIANVTLFNNTVSNVNIISRGSNYRYANITISGGNGTGASVRAIIAPKGGHGSNARIELGGYFIMATPQLLNTESGSLPVDFKFRISGIIKDPKIYGSQTERLTDSIIIGQKKLVLANVTGTFSYDEFIRGSSSLANARIVSAVIPSAGKANIIYYQASGVTANANNFSNLEIVTGVSSGAYGDIIKIIDQGLQPDTGEILYVDVFRPIQRKSDQTEKFQTVIEF